MRKFEKVKRLKGEEIELPKRSTKGSAGYDFKSVEDVFISFQGVTYVRTGIKARMEDDEILMLCNRSSNPKKKELVLINGVGIVDSDYYGNEENDGEIMFAFKSLNEGGSWIRKGDKIGQGIFIKFGKVEGDEADGERAGGFGSTGA